jgi:hypothetical protein
MPSETLQQLSFTRIGNSMGPMAHCTDVVEKSIRRRNALVNVPAELPPINAKNAKRHFAKLDRDSGDYCGALEPQRTRRDLKQIIWQIICQILAWLTNSIAFRAANRVCIQCSYANQLPEGCVGK